MHTKKTNRLLALALTIVMVMSLFVVPASAAVPMGGAAVEETPAEATGSAGLSAARPVANDEPAELAADDPDPAKVDVWDFGAEQLDATKFNNGLTLDMLNGWVDAGGSFPKNENKTSGDLTVVVPAGKQARLRSTTPGLRQNGGRNMTTVAGLDPYFPEGVTYNGIFASNSGANDGIALAVTGTAGDKVTYVYSENAGTASELRFTAPSGKVEVLQYEGGQHNVGCVHSFYLKEDGSHALTYFSNKFYVSRVYREKPADVAVSGTVTMPEGMTGLKLVFTNNDSGLPTETAVAADGTYTVTLDGYQAGTSYKVSTKDVMGAVIETGGTLELAGADPTKTHDVTVISVALKKVGGTVTGLADAVPGRTGYTAQADLKLSFEKPADKVHEPEIEYNATDGTWSTYVEPGVTYTVKAEGVNDFVAPTTVMYEGTEEKTDAVIAFTPATKKTVTIAADPDTVVLDGADTLTFTLLDSPNGEDYEKPYNAKTGKYPYVYTFKGDETVSLREGTYNVAVTTTKGRQKLTSNLKVAGADVTKTVKFDVEPEVYSEWSFKSGFGSENWAADVPKIEGTTGTWRNIEVDATYTRTDAADDGTTKTITAKFNTNGGTYAQFNEGTILKVPVPGATAGQKVKVSVAAYFNGNMTSTLTVGVGNKAVPNTGSNADRDKDIVLETVADEDGYITITATVSDYLTHIKVEPVEEDDTIYTNWDFVSGAPAKDEAYPAATTAGLSGTAPIKSHDPSKSYGAAVTAGTIVVPMVGKGTVNVNVGYQWDVQFESETADSCVTGDGGTKTLSYSYTSESDGTVTITIGAGCATTYISRIYIEYEEGVLPSADPITFEVDQAGGEGKYTTIGAALAAIKATKRLPGQRAIVEIAPGNYEEMIRIDMPDVTLKNTDSAAALQLTDEGVHIGEHEVRLTWYYGANHNYASQAANYMPDPDVLAVNKENGYATTENKSGTTTFYNSPLVITADGFEAHGIIFENSFNQYVSEKEKEDLVFETGSAPEVQKGATPRSQLPAGSTAVQSRDYVIWGGALGMKDGAGSALFDHCAFIGRQDTVYGGTGNKMAFYDCDIYGGVDYICGPMSAVFAKCNLVANTCDANNDVSYHTAAKTAPGTRGYLMWNCTVKSIEPGVNSASEKRSQSSVFGRPWLDKTNNVMSVPETVYYKTIVEATDPEWMATTGTSSMIVPSGWKVWSKETDTTERYYEYGTMEWYEDVDNSASRVSWAKTPTVTPGVDGAPDTLDLTTADADKGLNYTNWLGDWDWYSDKDMALEEHTPVPVTELVKTELEAAIADATAAKEGVETIDGKTAAEVDKDTKFVTTADVTKLDKAITDAQKVADNKFATDKQITDAKAAVEAAQAEFEAAIKTGTKEEGGEPAKTPAEKLADAIKAAEADAAATKESADGKNVSKSKKWVTPEVMEAYKAAIRAAKDVAEADPAADDDALNAALDALNDATETFTAAKKPGLQASSGTPAYGTGTKPDGTQKDVTETTTNTKGDTVTTVTKPDGEKDFTVVNADGEKLADVAIPATVSGKHGFVDVPENHWAAKSIDRMADLGMVKGVNDEGTLFDMSAPMTRAAIATMFQRLANGSKDIANTFADTEGHWAADAVAWANKAGVVTGYSAEAFGPDDSITRAQMAVMLARFADLLGLNTKASAAVLDDFTDGAADDWAVNGLAWCVANGIMQGRGDGTLDHATAITRCEATAMFDRMISLLQK